MKKIVAFLAIMPICFLVFKFSLNREKILVALGDSSCLSSSINGVRSTSYNDYFVQKKIVSIVNDDYCKNNLRIEELISNINSNYKVNNYSIKQTINSADYITVMIGYDEIFSYKDFNNILLKQFADNYKELIDLIKKNSKAKIIIIGFYPGYFRNYDELNGRIKQIAKNTNSIFVDTASLYKNKSFFYSENSYHLTSMGSKKIFELIVEKL